MSHRKVSTFIALACLSLVACGRKEQAAPVAAAPPPPAAGKVDDARLNNAASEPQSWLAHGGTQLAQRFSPLDQINADNVAQLKAAWTLDFDTSRGQESTPLVVDGVIYVTTAWSKVYAADARTGKELWHYDPEVPGHTAAKGCCDVVNRGPAVYRGKVFASTYDGRLIALDAATGKLAWSATTTDPDMEYIISGAPRVANGLVYIGNSSGEWGGRGFVSAYDADTGKLAWRFFLTPGDPAKPDGAASDDIMASLVQPTWSGPHNEYRGGGNAWNSIVYDPEFDQLYLATGNGFPWVRKFRSPGPDGKGFGDNLFICSVVALDAKTGKYKWHYQETPGDSWDYDSVADMILADLTIDGQPRKVLMHTPKNAFFYVIDRKDGKLISAKPYVPGVTWASSVDAKSGKPKVLAGAYYDEKPIRLSPGEGGGHSWHPTAFNPNTGLMYLQATANATTRYIPRKTFEWVKGLDKMGLYHFAQHGPDEPATAGEYKGPQPSSYLLAWNPVTQKEAWKSPGQGTGVLTTAGNLVFQGNSRNVVFGQLVAYRADSGAKVWSYDVPNAILTAPISYSIDGEQYIAFTSGAGGGSILGVGQDVRVRQPGRLVALKLNGTGTLPPEPAVAPPPNPPADVWPAATLAEGAQHYVDLCAHCHGIAARSANIIPDLRRSGALGNAAAWSAIVNDGALTARGMISWKKYLPEGGAETIRAYVATEARKGMTPAPATGTTGPQR